MNIIVALLGLVLFGNSEVTPLALHLSIDGDTFYPGEPVFSKLVIVNVSNELQKIPNMEGYAFAKDFLDFAIISADGNTMNKYGGEITYLLKEGGLISLQPADSITVEIPLDRYYGIFEEDEDGNWMEPWMIPPGNYTVKVKYEFPPHKWPKLQLWRGLSESNVCSFVIKEPIDEYAKVYNLYRKFTTLCLTFTWEGERIPNEEAFIKQIEIAKEIIEYKIEPYAVLSRFYLAGLYGLKVFYGMDQYKQSYKEESQKIYEKHPNTKVAQRSVIKYKKTTLRRLNETDEWVSYLEYLSENYSGTLVGNEASELLEKEKKSQE